MSDPNITPDVTDVQEVPDDTPVEDLRSDFDKLLSSLEIPKNIDPTILNRWIEQERKVFEDREGITGRPKTGISLARIFMAYIGIVGMLVAILLGTLRGDDAELILMTATISLLLYGMVGFFSGLITEYCIQESAISLAREVVSRSESQEQEA